MTSVLLLKYNGPAVCHNAPWKKSVIMHLVCLQTVTVVQHIDDTVSV